MCGIAGFFNGEHASANGAGIDVVREMTETLHRRGPDDSGVWCDESAGLFLGHRRLSIQDLSSDGSQPMTSADQRWTIVFNGEIYNFQQLRDKLESNGVRFRGRSDTEVFVELTAREGLMSALQASRGMFALAMWDSVNRRLYLARDRMGEKPLYYGRLGNTFVFASELKALHKHPNWRGKIDRRALTAYLRYNCVPGGFSIFEDPHRVA